MTMPTLARLREALHYDKKTGNFFWKVGGFRRRKGAKVGCKHKTLGYIFVGFDGSRYYAHHLAWFYTFGKWPSSIEFINGDKADTRISNLREKALQRVVQTKICPVCTHSFERPQKFSHTQWEEKSHCSRECAQERVRRQNEATKKCIECGSNGPFRIYTTSSGRKSRNNVCRKCFNTQRGPLRVARYRKAFTENPERQMYLRMASNARNRKTPVMTYEEFLSEIGGKIPERCPVLGLKLDFLAPSRSDSLPTIDRIDSTKSYVLGNIAVISWRANSIKRNYTAEDLRKIANWMDTKLSLAR